MVKVMINVVDVVLRGLPDSRLVVYPFGHTIYEPGFRRPLQRSLEARLDKTEWTAEAYRDTKGRECVSSIAVKKSFVSAGTAMDNLTRAKIRQALYVSSLLNRDSGMIPIEKHDGSLAFGVVREDACFIGRNTKGWVYRFEYPEWQLRVRIEYDPRLVSREQLERLIQEAGWGIGICEGRPERTPVLGWGRYAIESMVDRRRRAALIAADVQ